MSSEDRSDRAPGTHEAAPKRAPAEVSGPAPAKPPSPTETTKTLTIDEYREWVHDRVSRGVILKLGTTLGAIGLTGLLALMALGQREISNQVGGKLDPIGVDLRRGLDKTHSDLKGELGGLTRDLRDQLHKTVSDVHYRIQGEVAATLLREADLHRQLKLLASKAVEENRPEIERLSKQAVESAVPAKVETIAEQAVNAEVAKSGGLTAVLARRLRPIALGDEPAPPSQREQALRLMTIFAPDQKQLRADLIEILARGAASPSEVKNIALQYYRPTHEPGEDTAAVTTVLASLKQATSRDVEGLDYAVFLSKFSTPQVPVLLDFARDRQASNATVAVVVDALAKLDADEATQALVELAGQPDAPHAELAWSALASLPKDRKWKSESARRVAFMELWELVPQRLARIGRSQDRDLDRFIERLAVAVRANDRRQLDALRTEVPRWRNSRLEFVFREALGSPQSAVTRDLRGGDIAALQRFVQGDREVTVQPVAQALSSLLRSSDWEPVMTRRLDIAAESRSDGRYREALDTLVVAWLQVLADGSAAKTDMTSPFLEQLLKRLTTLPDCLYHRGTAEGVTFVVRRSGPQASETLLGALPKLVHGERFPGSDASFRGAEPVVLALERSSPEARGSLVLRFESEPRRFAPLAESFVRAGARKFESEAWSEAVEAYSLAIAVDGRKPSYYLQRALAQLNRGEVTRASADLREALSLGGHVSKDEALEFVRLGDEDSARRAVLKSVEAFSDPDERAGARENLGLYFIRVRQWEKAFKHTDEVMAESRKSPWNWLVRAIAARHLGQVREEQEAFDTWKKMDRPQDFQTLRRYIPAQTDEYLRLRGGGAQPRAGA